MTDNIIKIENLSRSFGNKRVLDNISLEVPKGSVFGLVGENGAGKTTIIKHILGLLRAKSGSVSVLGLDPVADPAGVLGEIGYLSEERDLPGWMRIDELIRYSQPFYPNWDQRYAMELLSMFELDSSQKIKDLSRGQRARAALLIALAHKPKLLLLDEPSSGLDPIVRRDILGAIIQTVTDDGRTVLFSSHLLDEVERVTEHVAMIHKGSLVLQDTMDNIKNRHHKIVLHFDKPADCLPTLPGILFSTGGPQEWTCFSNGLYQDLKDSAINCGARIVTETVPTLEEIFVSIVNRKEA